MKISQAEIDRYAARIRKLSNSARYDEAYRLAKKLNKQHPDVLLFAYMEAVFTAEDDINFSKQEIKRRYKSAAKKLRLLIRRLRSGTPRLRFSIRNEYYWFSGQPLKQYKLGLEAVASGQARGHYPAGVGAAQLAKKYALRRQKNRAVKWAKVSEQAWLSFFQEDSKWFNSYFFYATALGIQGRVNEMDKALLRSARIAGKSPKWKAIVNLRREILEAANYIART